MRVEGAEVRRVREALGESKRVFGQRFARCRRTIIRWEKDGAIFSDLGRWDCDLNKRTKSDAEFWREVAAEAATAAKKEKARGVVKKAGRGGRSSGKKRVPARTRRAGRRRRVTRRARSSK